MALVQNKVRKYKTKRQPSFWEEKKTKTKKTELRINTHYLLSLPVQIYTSVESADNLKLLTSYYFKLQLNKVTQDDNNFVFLLLFLI